MRTRLLILGAIVLLWAIAACSLSQLERQRTVLVTVAPTRTPKPTYTATATPRPTLTASPTPTPSNTPRPTLRPTDTPQPTVTPSPTLSPTASYTPPPTPVPTDTPRPTPRPTRRPTNTAVPQPTRTPSPPFTGTIVSGSIRCDGYRGVEGHVKHGDGSAYPGVAIGIWSDAWSGIVTTSEPNGKYAFNLMNLPPGKFKLAVVTYETCALQGELRTANACQRQSGIVEITLTENCTGSNANQVSLVDFTGP
jgi:hypothetical protein